MEPWILFSLALEALSPHGFCARIYILEADFNSFDDYKAYHQCNFLLVERGYSATDG